MISQPRAVTPFRPSLSSHLHAKGETCPWCEQEIPPEKLEAISGKIALREHEQSLAITARLEQKFEAERMEAEAIGKANLELERCQSAAREAAAREEARKIAETAAAEKIAVAETNRQQLEAALQTKIKQEQAAREAAHQAIADHQAQLQREREASAAALAAAKADAEAHESAIRTEAQQLAEAAVAEKLAAREATRAEVDAALRTQIEVAEQKGAVLQEQLTALQQATNAELTKVKEDAGAEVIRIREATTTAEAAMQAKMMENEHALIEANTKAQTAEEKLNTTIEQQEAALAARLAEQREALEKAKVDAVNAEKSKFFEENLKLTNKVEELKRTLEKKSNEELGEGAEIDLFEALKAEFPDDNIQRIPKGSPGADIRHIVMMNGNECGTILFDSKNHNQFRTEHVTKLKADQIADKAEHAILSTYKFPQGTRHLHVQDGVVLVSPARVVAIATIIRGHMTQMYTLRVSRVERESKMSELFEFIVSERCTQLLGRIEKQAEDLLELQAKEIKWHKNNWEKQGEAYKAIQKAKGDLETDIGRIIGTAAALDPLLAEGQS
jgi:hypothetical protein